MPEIQLNGKTIATQTGTNEPVLKNNVVMESGFSIPSGVTFPAGHVIQIAQGFSQATIATTSTSFVASALTTGLPELASTSNKVLVQMIGGLADVNTGSVNVAYQLHESIAGGSYSLVTNAQNDTHILDATNRFPYAMSYLFTPNAGNGTTSSIDVKIYFKTSANQGFLNYPGNLISLTIMEISQ